MIRLSIPKLANLVKVILIRNAVRREEAFVSYVNIPNYNLPQLLKVHLFHVTEFQLDRREDISTLLQAISNQCHAFQAFGFQIHLEQFHL